MSNVKIYYVNYENNSELFKSHMAIGFKEPPTIKIEDYRLLWEGEIKDPNLEDIFRNSQNLDHQQNQFSKDRSMSVGDLVQIDNTLYFCANIGWKKVEWYEKEVN